MGIQIKDIVHAFLLLELVSGMLGRCAHVIMNMQLMKLLMDGDPRKGNVDGYLFLQLVNILLS